jgi:sec-independent protein translocase protein TatC
MRNPLRRRAAPTDRSGPMTLVEHLVELRSRLIKTLLAVALGAVIGFLLYGRVLDWLVQPYCDVKRSFDATTTCRLVVTDPLESLSIRLKLSAYLGLLIASPVVLWQLWRFITPGLYAKEKRYAIPFVASSVLLFLAGAGLAILTFSKTLEFFAAFGGNDLELLYTPGKYLGLLILMMVIFGLGFEFPVVLTFLQVAGVLHWRRLASWRRYAIVSIFVVDAVITPSGDPVTLLAMALPMVIFYEISILIGRFVLRRP